MGFCPKRPTLLRNLQRLVGGAGDSRIMQVCWILTHLELRPRFAVTRNARIARRDCLHQLLPIKTTLPVGGLIHPFCYVAANLLLSKLLLGRPTEHKVPDLARVGAHWQLGSSSKLSDPPVPSYIEEFRMCCLSSQVYSPTPPFPSFC